MPKLHDADGFHDALWRYTHGGPRTWSEIMGAFSGLGANVFARDEMPDLTDEEAARVAHYEELLEQLYQEGRIEIDTRNQDYRLHLIKPIGAAPPEERRSRYHR